MVDLGQMSLGLTLGMTLVTYVLTALGYYKMFEKAGEKNWKGFIPIYNNYVAYQISWERGKPAFWAVFALVLAYSSFWTVSQTVVIYSTEFYACYITATICLLLACLVHAFFCTRQAMSFDRGNGFAALAFFFYPFVMMYYGFSKDVKYYAPLD